MFGDDTWKNIVGSLGFDVFKNMGQTIKTFANQGTVLIENFFKFGDVGRRVTQGNNTGTPRDMRCGDQVSIVNFQDLFFSAAGMIIYPSRQPLIA